MQIVATSLKMTTFKIFCQNNITLIFLALIPATNAN